MNRGSRTKSGDERSGEPDRRGPIRLNKAAVTSLSDGPERGRWHSTELPGLYVVAYPQRSRVFWVKFRVRGRRRALKVGRFGMLTVDQARKYAVAILADAARDVDPAAERDKARAVPVFGEWKKMYLERIEKTKKTTGDDRRYLGLAEERWKNRSLDEITTSDVESFRLKLADGDHYPRANRALASVSACFSAAVRDGLTPANPAARVRPFRENPPRARVLSDAERARLLAALASSPEPDRTAFYVLLETGCRVSEITSARWADLDLDARTWRIPSPKAGRPQIVPLAEITAKRLETLKRGPLSEWVVPAISDLKIPRWDLRDEWNALKERAGLPADLWIHDLRRSFGLAAARSVGLHMASRLLRHSNVRITERVYAPLDLNLQRDAVETVASLVTGKKTRKTPRRSGP